MPKFKVMNFNRLSMADLAFGDERNIRIILLKNPHRLEICYLHKMTYRALVLFPRIAYEHGKFPF